MDHLDRGWINRGMARSLLPQTASTSVVVELAMINWPEMFRYAEGTGPTAFGPERLAYR